MHRGIFVHMTSRNKALLEDAVSSLWELETARRRQERLVLGVLVSRDADKTHETLKWQQNPLLDAPSGVMAALQQLSELTVGSNTEAFDNVSSSGFYEQNEFQSALKHSRSFPTISSYSHRGRSVEDAYMQDWEGQRPRPTRCFLPRSFSAPYPPLEGIAEAVEDAEEDDNETMWSKGQTPNGEDTNRPDGGTIKGSHSNENGGAIGIHCDYQGPTVEVSEDPTEEDIQQAMHVETYILGLLQRYFPNQIHLCQSTYTTTDSTEVLSSGLDCWQEPQDYPPSYSEHPEKSEWQEWKLYSDKNASPDRYYVVNKPDLCSQAFKDSGSSIESPTVTADLDSHHLYYPSAYSPLTSKSLSQDWKPLESTSQKTAHHLTVGKLYQEESWSSSGHRHVKTSTQSRSESSFQSHSFAAEPEYGYPSLGPKTDMHCFSDDYTSSQRPWSSALDLSQEEKASFLREEERLMRDTHLPLNSFSTHSSSNYTEQDHYVGNDPNARETQIEESDSSLSETCSPRSSSRSSDSDDSGGLVWPQQVPPYVPSFCQNAPTAVVRIKASHALKRKILRFRSGSLKVMTTV